MRDHELVYRAVHDSRTGLTNRYGLQMRLDALLAGWAKAAGWRWCPSTRPLQERQRHRRGHAAGDELLCAASQRLQACVPAGAVVARPGGDEFIVLLPGADETTATG